MHNPLVDWLAESFFGPLAEIGVRSDTAPGRGAIA